MDYFVFIHKWNKYNHILSVIGSYYYETLYKAKLNNAHSHTRKIKGKKKRKEIIRKQWRNKRLDMRTELIIQNDEKWDCTTIIDFPLPLMVGKTP